MKTWWAIFSAELRRTRGYIPWLLLAHGLTLACETHWSGSTTPWLAGSLRWLTCLLAGYVMISGLWEASPTRGDGILACRPVKRWVLSAGLISALWLVVVLPFVVVEALALQVIDLGTRVTVLGTLQLVLLGTVVLLAAVPLVWWWRRGITAIGGAAIDITAGLVTIWYLDKHPASQLGGIAEAGARGLFELLIIAVLGLLGLSAAGLMTMFSRSKEWQRTIVFGALVAASLILGERWVLGPPKTDVVFRPKLVHINAWSHRMAEGFKTEFELEPEEPRLEEGRGIAWSYLNATDKYGAIDLTPRAPEGWLGSAIDESAALAFQKYSRTHFSKDFVHGYEVDKGGVAGTIWISGDKMPRPLVDLNVEMLGSVIEWRAMVDLPLEVGSEVQNEWGRWRVTDAVREDQGSSFAGIPHNWWDKATIRWEAPHLWIGGQVEDRGMAPEYLAGLLYDPSDPLVRFIYFGAEQRSHFGRQIHPPETLLSMDCLQMFVSWPVITEERLKAGVNVPSDYRANRRRVVLFRPVVVGHVGAKWQGPEKEIHFHDHAPSSSLTQQRRRGAGLDASPTLGKETDEIVNFARSGGAWKVTDSLLSNPKQMGMSEEEWKSYFRIYPSAEAYRALAGTVLPEEVIREEARWRLERFEALLEAGGRMDLIELGLAMGHADAPRWLHKASMRNDENARPFGPTRIIQKYFEDAPQGLREPKAWFEVIDPASFVYDPELQRYRVR